MTGHDDLVIKSVWYTLPSANGPDPHWADRYTVKVQVPNDSAFGKLRWPRYEEYLWCPLEDEKVITRTVKGQKQVVYLTDSEIMRCYELFYTACWEVKKKHERRDR